MALHTQQSTTRHRRSRLHAPHPVEACSCIGLVMLTCAPDRRMAPLCLAQLHGWTCPEFDTTLQVSQAFSRLLENPCNNEDLQRELFCAQPERFRRHVRAHVAAMAPHGFNAAAVGALTARDARLLLRDADWPAVQFEMLRAFFAPYGDAPATIVRMTKGLRASLPAVVPGATPAVGTTPEPTLHADISCVHKAILACPSYMTSWTREGLRQHMRTLVAAGLFADDENARRECMQRPHLLQGNMLRWYIERKAAVLEAGGSMDDALAACCNTGSTQSAYPCLLLWQRSRCAAT